jgi:hypothetical protein
MDDIFVVRTTFQSGGGLKIRLLLKMAARASYRPAVRAYNEYLLTAILHAAARTMRAVI